MTADVNWYVGIAERGYEQISFNADVQRNWAFFPLFPLLLRLASYLTGEFVITGMALSHICFLLALFFLHRVSLLFGLSVNDADRALIALCLRRTLRWRCRERQNSGLRIQDTGRHCPSLGSLSPEF